jgi:hypothetical protein
VVAFVCPSRDLRSSSGFRGGNLHGGFIYWINVFKNFILEENGACLAGVDLKHYVPKGELDVEGQRNQIWWNICLMGGAFSPYQTGQEMGHAKEMIMGDPNDCLNVLMEVSPTKFSWSGRL